MDETAKFKAGFSECARLVRDVLQSQMDSTGLDHRTNKHLERCLANLDRALMMHQSVRSPSPLHSSSESCSSFEGKDTVLLSPQSTTDRSSPVDHALLWSSKATAFTPPDQHIGGRRCRSSSSHDVQSPSFPYSPDSSPVVADQHSSDCSMFMSTPSSALTATAAVSSAVEGRNIINNKSSGKWQQQRQVVTSPFQQHQQHSEWQMSDAHVMELRPCGRSSVKASSLVSFPLFTCSKTGTEDPTGRVWRPWWTVICLVHLVPLGLVTSLVTSALYIELFFYCLYIYVFIYLHVYTQTYVCQWNTELTCPTRLRYMITHAFYVGKSGNIFLFRLSHGDYFLTVTQV